MEMPYLEYFRCFTEPTDSPFWQERSTKLPSKPKDSIDKNSTTPLLTHQLLVNVVVVVVVMLGSRKPQGHAAGRYMLCYCATLVNPHTPSNTTIAKRGKATKEEAVDRLSDAKWLSLSHVPRRDDGLSSRRRGLSHKKVNSTIELINYYCV